MRYALTRELVQYLLLLWERKRVILLLIYILSMHAHSLRKRWACQKSKFKAANTMLYAFLQLLKRHNWSN